MERIQHDLIQGSIEWQQFRLEHDGASEAAAMLGLSKKTTRNELLRMKHTGIAKEFSDWVQKNILDKGHEVEAQARPLVEKIIGEDLYPVTYSSGRKSASCDGLTMDGETAFEHKQWNAALAASIARGELPEEHQPQCQQIMDVTGAKRVIFTVSDGTPENLVWMEVFPDPAWVARIDAGWAQFHRDLAEYVPQEIIPAAVATPQTQLPSVSVQVLGSIEVRDNLDAFSKALSAYVERINRKPETDQDFADLEASCKTLKEAETALDAAENGALGQVESIDKVRRLVAESRELARSTRLTIEKLVKAEKENRRLAILQGAQTALAQHVAALNLKIGKSYLPSIAADFAGVMRSKKTIASLQNAVDTELARCKIEADRLAADIEANLASLRELAADHTFLFADIAQIVLKQNDDLVLLIKSRIADHQAAEEKRLAAEREKIRAEEAAKLERQQAERQRVSALWDSALMAAVAEDQRQAGIAAAEKITQDAKPVEQAETTPTLGQVLHAAAPAAIANAITPINSAWQKSHDEVAALLADMSLTELSLARAALVKIRNERQVRAA